MSKSYNCRETEDLIEVRRERCRPKSYMRADLGYDEADIARAVEIYDFFVGTGLVDKTDATVMTLQRIYERKTASFKKMMAANQPFSLDERGVPVRRKRTTWRIMK